MKMMLMLPRFWPRRNAMFKLIIVAAVASIVSLPIVAVAWAEDRSGTEFNGVTNSPTARTKQIQEVLGMTMKPVTPEELLKNIKLALENNLFLREDFYTEDNFRRVFGDYAYSWRDNDAEHKFVDMEPTVQARPSSQGHPCLKSGALSWGVNSVGGKARGWRARIVGSLLHADPRCSSFSADLIESLFGKPTKVTAIFENNRPPPHGRNVVFGPKTHPLGHSDIEFDLGDAAISKIISFEIRGDGICTGFGLTVGDK
jgi:hypothetical protein